MNDSSPFLNAQPSGKSSAAVAITMAKGRLTKAHYAQIQRDRRNPKKRKRKEA